MYGSNVLNNPAVSGQGIPNGCLTDSQQAAWNGIQRELAENSFIKGFQIAIALSIPIWAIIIWGIKIIFF